MADEARKPFHKTCFYLWVNDIFDGLSMGAADDIPAICSR